MSGQLMTPSSGARMRRGITALIVLCGLIVGVPGALLSVGGDPMPHHVASLSAVRHALTSSDTSGHLFLGLALTAAWLGWAAFALSVVLELLERLRHRPTMRIPGLGAPRRAAAGLFTAIAIMMGSGGMAATAFADAPPPPPAAVVVIGQPVMLDGSALPADAASSTLVYHVVAGDNLGDIAQRFLGRFDLYPRLVAANPTLITHGPDHIQPGWTLRLPSDARDRGVRAHAKGTLSSTLIAPESTTAAVVASTSDPVTIGTVRPAPAGSIGLGPVASGPITAGQIAVGPLSPAAGPVLDGVGIGSTPRPTHVVAHATPALRQAHVVTHATKATGATAIGTAAVTATITGPVATDTSAQRPVVIFGAVTSLTAEQAAMPVPDDSASPALIAAALALTTGALGAHMVVRQRRRRSTAPRVVGHPHHEPEPATAHSLDLNRLDLALRDLGSLLGERDQSDLPDIMGSWIADGVVHLMLTRPCPAPPAPWVADGLMWTLPAHVPTHTYFAGTTPPLPALVTVGGGEDRTVLLDLERLGVVTIGGDHAASSDLLRHVGAELSHGIWSEGVTVGLAGFDPDDARQLVALGRGRVHASASIADALDRAGRWINEAHERLSGMGVANVLSGRVTGDSGRGAAALAVRAPDRRPGRR